MKLFLVQDTDNPAYVVAKDWSDAVTRWRLWYRATYDDDDCQEMQPDGIQLLGATSDDPSNKYGLIGYPVVLQR